MIKTLQIGSLVIDGDPYTVEEFGGLGSSNVELTTFARPSIRGKSFIRSTYRERRLSLTGNIVGDTINTYLANRRALFGALNVSDGLFLVKFTLQDDTALQFYAVVENPIEAPYKAGETTHGPYLVELIAPDPAFYSQTTHTKDVTLASGEVINNAGNLGAYPTLTITGPGTDFSLLATAESTGIGKTMTLTGTLASGETYEINVLEKTVYRNGSINEFNAFSGLWWNIEAGNNTVQLSCSSGSSPATKLTVKWQDAYIGV